MSAAMTPILKEFMNTSSSVVRGACGRWHTGIVAAASMVLLDKAVNLRNVHAYLRAVTDHGQRA